MKHKFFLQMLMVVALAVALCAPLAWAAQGQPQQIEIVAKRFEYIPSVITLKEGVPVVLVLTSKDVSHGLKFKELGLDMKAKKGTTSEVTFTPQKTGTFVGECSVFCGSGHGSMKLTLHVTE